MRTSNKTKAGNIWARRAVSAALALAFALQGTAAYAEGLDSLFAWLSRAAGVSTVQEAGGAAAPLVDLTGATDQIVKIEIREGGASGPVLTTLVGPADDPTLKAPLLLERGKDYTLSVAVHKTAQANTEGYVRLRFGREAADGSLSYNGLTFKNPPGTLYMVGQFDGHTYLDAVAARQDAPNPTYGTKPSTYSEMKDGVFVYHEKSSVSSENEITFVVQFMVDDVGYDGSGWLLDGMQLQTGVMENGAFAAEATMTASLPVEKNPQLVSSFNGTSKTATLGGNGQMLTYSTQEEDNATQYLGLIYEKNEFDIVYPKGATIGDFGFNTAYSKTDATRGKVEMDGAPVDNGDGTMTQHFVTSCGYKARTSDPAYYYYLTFPEGAFTDGQKVTTTLNNMTYTCKTGSGDEDEVVIKVTAPKTAVTYTIVDPTKDSTALTAVNRTTGDGVYNITGVTETAGRALTSLGGCRITNTVSVETPFAKTYEAQFNTTNTAAAITYITVPLGNTGAPVVQLTGKSAETGEIITVTVDDPLNYRLNTRYAMAFRAQDHGLSCFTAVKAEIGQLNASTDTSSWTSNFDLSANLSGAYGYFTTDEPGIVVKNTYRLYNTEPEYQAYKNGDLTVTSQTVSSTEARVGYTATVPAIYDAAGKKTVTAVDAGDEVLITGTVYPYQVPYAEGYRTGSGAAANVYGNTSFITDPVLYVTLPAGMTLNTQELSFQVNSYSYRNDKTSTEQVTPTAIENVSYLNQSEQDMNLYRITFSGQTLGYFAEGTDTAGNVTMLRRQLYYKIKLKTSKSLETKIYYIDDLLGIASANPVTALPYSSSQSLCTVKTDVYGINDGRDYAAILPEKNKTVGFGVQQQAEVNINNAVTVNNGTEGGEGEPAPGEWLTYDETDPNSVLMMGRVTNGRYRLRVANTSALPATDVSVLVPLPRQGQSLGNAFMARDEGTFAFTMDVSWADDGLDGFTPQYVKLNKKIDLWNQTVPLEGLYTVVDKKDADAILLTRSTIAPGAVCNITLQYAVSTTAELTDKQNLFRNIFRYTVDKVAYSGLGSYVACEIAEGTLSGTAFADTNRNGVRDEGEAALPGVSVVAKDGQGKILSTTTDENGQYSFSAIREEQITVTYALGSAENAAYRFNVAADGLTAAADKKSATAYYAQLPEKAQRDVPLATYWTLTYDGNQATSGLVPAAQEYDPGNAIATVRVKPDNLYKKYSAFVGWNTQQDGSGTQYLPNAQFTMTGDTTLYAQWTPGTYIATIDYQGGTSTTGITQLTVTYGEKFYNQLPAGDTITRQGYTFNGWAGNLTTTGRYNSGATWNMENGTIYARYAEKTGFTVTYDTGAGGSTVDPLTNLKWTASVTPTADPTRPGYTFAGWTYNGQPVPTGTSYGALAQQDSVTSIVLTASWAPKGGYTVSYDLNLPKGATGAPAAADYPPLTGVTWTQTGLLPGTAPSCPGYAFAGWYADGQTQVSAADAYGTLAASDKATGITLTAHWQTVTGQIVHYDANGGTAVNDKLVDGIASTGLLPAAGATTRPGYTFAGWTYTKADGTVMPVTDQTAYQELTTENSLTLQAVWQAKTYTIQYGEPSLAESTTGKAWGDSGLIADAAKALTKTGYTFAGWTYNGSEVTAASTVAQLNPADDAPNNTLVLTPVWAQRTYSVVYSTGGGGTVPTKTGVAYTATGLVAATNPSKTGYIFTGWVYGEVPVTGATTIESLIGAQANADTITSITLDAAYAPKTGYRVKYDTAGGTAIADKEGVSWNSSGLLPETDPKREGYTFGGWSGGRVDNVTDATTYAAIAENNDTGAYITLVAKWALNTYPIAYRDAGDKEFSGDYAEGVSAPQTHTYGTATALPTPCKTGYDFVGWYTSSDCAAGSKVTQLAADAYTGAVGTVTLYAKWIEKTEVTGLVQIHYGDQLEAQKANEVFLLLQRRTGTGEFVQVGEALKVTFAREEGATKALSAFAFLDVPATDDDGNRYEYRVTTTAANYSVARGTPIGGTGSTAYDLVLTYAPDTFALTMQIQAGQYIAPADLPQAVRVRVIFSANPHDDTFTDGTIVVGSANGADPTKDDWIYITEHDDASLTVKLSWGMGSADYPVQKAWNTDGGQAYYQFGIEAYQLADGTWVQKGAENDPYTVTYAEPCVSFASASHELTVTLNRKNTVRFALQGGTANTTDGQLPTQTKLGGETITRPTDPTRTGYTFGGWYTDADCTSEWNFANKVSGDMTLYAKWTANQYTITFAPNGGAGGSEAKQVTYAEALPALAAGELPVWAGHTFLGYYTTASGEDGVCWYDAAGKPVLGTAYLTAGDTTLYAHWADNITVSGTATIQYTYQNEDGKTVTLPTEQRVRTATIWLERKLATADDSAYLPVTGKSETVTFSTDDSTATASYSFSNLPPQDEQGNNYAYRVNSTVTNYTVEIQPQSATVCNLQFTFAPATFALPITVDANAIPAGERPAAVRVQLTSATAPASEYTGGWPVLGQLGDTYITLTVDAETGVASGNYSVWQATQDAAGTAVPLYYQLAVVGYQAANGSAMTDAPYFVSAYGACGGYAGETAITGVSATLGRTYRVTFSTQDKGDTTPVPLTVPLGETAGQPDSDAIREEGYHIAGWYTNAECTGTAWDFATPITADTILYANWQPNGYQIRFYDDPASMNAGQDTIEQVEITYLAAWPAVPAPTKEGCAFMGYYRANAQGGETCYYNAQGVPQQGSYDTPANTSLYAKWMKLLPITGQVTIHYTYRLKDQQTDTPMAQPQRLGAVQLLLQRQAQGSTQWETIDTAEAVFAQAQQMDVLADKSAFRFASQPEKDENGNAYTYRVTSETANYQAVYSTDPNAPYDLELVADMDTFYLSLAVDARGIPSGAPVSVDVKVAFLWYTPTEAFTGVVDGNPFATADGKPDPHRWRYLTEFIPDAAVQNVPLTGGVGTLVYPVISQGVRSGDTTVPEAQKNDVVPYYYQFVITAYHMADGSVIPAKGENDPFTPSWQQAYAYNDRANADSRALTIALSRSYTVNFNLLGHGTEAAPEAQTLTNGQAATKPADPTAEGYTFGGWYTNAACTGAAWDFANTVTGDMTLYANWIKLQTISGQALVDFTCPENSADPDSARIEMQVEQKPKEVKVTLERKTDGGQFTQVQTITVPVSEEARAQGKSSAIVAFAFANMPEKDENGSAYTYRVTADVPNYTVQTGATINGVASPYHLALTYNPNTFALQLAVDAGALTPENRPAAVNVKVVFCAKEPGAPYTGVVDGGTTDPGQYPTLWRYVTEHADGVLRIPLGEDGKGSASYPVLVHQNNDSSLKFYYQFVVYSYTMADGTTLLAKAEDDPFTVGYTGNYSAYLDPNAAPGDTRTQGVSATLSRTYTVTFAANGHGTAPAGKTAENGSPIAAPAAPSATGYTFGGWYTDAACATAWDFDTQKVTTDMTLYAKWKANQYAITYMDGATEITPALAPATHTYGAPTRLPVPEKSGYTFAGWYANAEFTGGKLEMLGETACTAPITLYAKWALNQYAVTTSLTGLTADAPASIAHGQTLTVTLQPADAHYTLPQSVTVTVGGAPVTDYTYSSTTGQLTLAAVTGSVQITAQGVAKTYTVAFDANGHGTAPASQPVTAGQTATKPADPAEEGYTFGGWYTEPACTTAWDFATAVTGNVTLYAKWTENAVTPPQPQTYTVAFDANGHGTAPASQPVTAGQTATKPADPAEEGYTFAGWYTEPACTTAWDFATAVTGNVTLYAKWTANTTGTETPQTAQTPLLAPLVSACYTQNAVDVAALNIGGMVSDGGQLSYQWYAKAPGAADFAPLPTVTAATLVPDVTAQGTYQYYCVVTNTLPNGSTATASSQGAPATIMVVAEGETPMVAAGQPTATAAGGGTYPQGQAVTLSVTAASPDADAGGQLSYQWYAKAPGDTAFSAVAGALDPTLTPQGLTPGDYQYYCAVTNTIPAGANVLSATASAHADVVTVTIIAPPPQPQTYTVSFALNGAEGAAPADQTVDEGALLTEPAAPSRVGYRFSGWYTEDTCTTAWDFAADTVSRAMTLYAGWQPCTHQFGAWTVVTPATQTAPGKEQHTCALCGLVESRDIPALPPAQTQEPANTQPPAASSPAVTQLPAASQSPAVTQSPAPALTPAATQPTAAPAPAATPKTGDSGAVAPLALALLLAAAAFVLAARRRKPGSR